MKKILVLGMTGMLGSMVYDILSQNENFDVRGTTRKLEVVPSVWKEKTYLFDAESDSLESKVFQDFQPDYIVNCVGILKPYCKDNDPEGVLRAIRINALFPHLLIESARKIGARVIQIATDCVYSGNKGQYTEQSSHDALDVYGKTKSLGEVGQPGFLNLRCSIIGPELKNKTSLLEWFLSQTPSDNVTGFTHHLWNGVTTLQFARVCEDILEKGDIFYDELTAASNVHHLVINETVNKYQLLNIFNEVFGKGLDIKSADNIGQPVDRSLSTQLTFFKRDKLVPMKEAISELYEYMKSHKLI